MYDEFAPDFTSDEFLMNNEPEEDEEEEGDLEGDSEDDEDVDLPDTDEEETM